MRVLDVDARAHPRHGGRAARRPSATSQRPGALNLAGLDLAPATVDALLHVDRGDWEREAADQGEFFSQFGDHLPAAVAEEHAALTHRLEGWQG